MNYYLTRFQSPAQNILVESIYCNWSGGCAMGSLSTDVNISDVTYRNIYTWSSNQMYMIKSNGGWARAEAGKLNKAPRGGGDTGRTPGGALQITRSSSQMLIHCLRQGPSYDDFLEYWYQKAPASSSSPR